MKKTLIAAGVALSLSGAGSASAQLTTTSPEYLTQPGLGAINIFPAWNAGLTGQGITIAVLDTGVRASHVDIAPNLLPGGIDLYNGDNDPNDDDVSEVQGHGTAMAGVAAAAQNGTGIVGVAYNAKILPYKIVGSTGGTTSTIAAAAIQAATSSSARIIVTAYGSDGSDPNAEIAALTAAGNANKIIIISAGNEGYPEPRFPGSIAPGIRGMIVVGAANGEGTAIFSSRAGTNTRFMVAPGIGIISDGNSSDTALTPPIVGSSMAAPHVAGAAAILLQASPNLSNSQVVEILLSTARDLGAPGFDDTFGWGMLDIGAALSPIGSISVGGGSGGAGGIGLALGAAGVVAALVARGGKMHKTLVLDQYERPYYTDLRDLISTRDSKPGLASLMESFRYDSAWMEVPLGGNNTLALSALGETPLGVDAFNYFSQREEQENRNTDVVMSLTGGNAGGLMYQFDYNRDPRKAYGSLGETQGVQFLSEQALTAPYLGFAQRGDSLHLGYHMSDNSMLKMGVANMDEGGEHGRKSQAAVVEGSFDLTPAASVALQLGNLTERGGLFGASSGGAFGIRSASTTAVGLSGRYELTPDLALLASYSEGYTRVKEAENKLLGNYSALRTNTYGLGLLASNVMRRHDRLGVAVSHPLRITSGSADLTVPASMDLDGKIHYYDTDRIGLDPDGNELDVEFSYQMPLGRTSQFATYFLYQNEPLHVQDTGDSVTVYAVLQRSF
jgi:hypothetical protein